MESLFQTRIKRQLRRARARSGALHARTVAAALEGLRCGGSRSGYAERVIDGRARWSGADLRGAARHYGAHYAEMRQRSSAALTAAGGEVIPTEHGLLLTAVLIPGVEVDGCPVYATANGIAARAGGAANYRHV